MKILNNTEFHGVSGPMSFLGADRKGIINIRQNRGNHTLQVGRFIPSNNETVMTNHLDLKAGDIRWYTSGGRVPIDGRPGQ